MRNAAMERLSKLITDPPRKSLDKRGRRLPAWSDAGFSFHLEEGWFSFFLLTFLVFNVMWSIQAADWVDNLIVLPLIVLVGLLVGVWSTKQKAFPLWLVDAMAVVIGLLLTYWQLVFAYYGGSLGNSLQGIVHWYASFSSGHSGDDSFYFLLILLLCYGLAYVSALSLYRWHQPWSLVILNTIVLIANLNAMSQGTLLLQGDVLLLMLFLLVSLFLLLRFNLSESLQRWRRQGLRYSDNLTWDVMQSGIVLILGILILSWVLPGQYAEPHLAQIWTMNNSLGQFANTFSHNFGPAGGPNQPNPGNFGNTLQLGRNPNLTKVVVFKAQTDDKQSHYLSILTYDTYDQGWSMAHTTEKYHIDANTTLNTSAKQTHAVNQTITVVTPPGEQAPYLPGASDIIRTSMSANVVDGTGGVIAWLGDDSTSLKVGSHFTVTSAVSSADINMLRQIPMPADSPSYNPGLGPSTELPISFYGTDVVNNFTQVPTYLEKDKRIHTLAQKIVGDAKATTMYDKVVALETYLRQHYTYNQDVHPRAGIDPVLWFLFENKQQDGYCNYFSTAMTLLARSLGIPAREVAGYTGGTTENGSYIIRGTDAHSWTQIYFAGYGWINFEPSASFKTFERPQPDQYQGSTDTTGNAATLPLPGAQTQNRRIQRTNEDGSSSSTENAFQGQVQAEWNLVLGILLLLLALGSIGFFFWWKGLFRQYSLATQFYGRICILAEWAGIHRQESQTPYEYLQDLASSALPTSEDAIALERLGDIYVRERWADPSSGDHPRRTGEIDEIPGLWRRLRLQLFWYVLRHPAFLQRIPDAIGQRYQKFYKRRQKLKSIRKAIHVEF